MKSTLYNISPMVSDSLKYAGKFLQTQPVKIRPETLEVVRGHSVFYVLFGLLALLAFLRFFYPAFLETLFASFLRDPAGRDTDNAGKRGWAVPLFLTLNALVSVTLLLVIFLIKKGLLPAGDFTQLSLWGVLAAAVVLYYITLQFVTFLTGFIFNVKTQASLQLRNNARWIQLSGILLTPLLLVYFYSGSTWMADIMMVTALFVLAAKWIQTVRIGWMSHKFSLLHIFLYLCAVEIVPLLLLVKWGSGISFPGL